MAVIATAGHVDHGKSTLVRLLTGQEPDRWAEERRRGLTIDLGYAWTDIDGRRVSLVDVPGHEHFTGNMLAGLGPVAAVMFVVAADDGWRPQSEEHARAVAALGIEHVLLVVTRCDLAPGEDAAQESVKRLESLGVAVSETVLVSGATGDGLADLRAALGRLSVAAEPQHPTVPATGSPATGSPVTGSLDAEPSDPTPPPDHSGRPVVRLWVDRTFTIRGAGTVVTGTLSEGQLVVGSELLLHGDPVRVRGLQTCGEDVRTVVGPARVAVNLRGVEVGQVSRGTALLDRRWSAPPFAVVDVALRPLRDLASGPGTPAPPRLPRELTLHVGTAAVPVRTQVLADGLVRLRLAASLPLAAGDRAVLRDPGRHAVVAGVDIRVVDPPTRRRHRQRADAAHAAYATHQGPGSAPGSEGDRRARPGVHALVGWLEEHPLQAPSHDQLDLWALAPRDLAEAADRGEILRVGGVVLGGDALGRAEAAIRSLGEQFTVGEAARAMGTSRRVAVPLLERLDAHLVTRRLPDGSREVRHPVTP